MKLNAGMTSVKDNLHKLDAVSIKTNIYDHDRASFVAILEVCCLSHFSEGSKTSRKENIKRFQGHCTTVPNAHPLPFKRTFPTLLSVTVQKICSAY